MSRTKPLTIRELTDIRDFGLTVEAGHGGLERGATWVYVSDLEDPAAWLDGQEIVLTNGLGIPAEPGAQAEFVARLDEKGASALVIGIRHPRLHSSFFQEADDRAFPLLRIAPSTRFQDLSRLVVDAARDDASRRVDVQLRIFDTFFPRAIGEYTSLELFKRLERVTGYELHLITESGYSLILGLPPPPLTVLDELQKDSPRLPLQPKSAVLRIPFRKESRALLVALETAGQQAAGLGSIRPVATIAALELAEVLRSRAEAYRIDSRLLTDMLSGRREHDEVMERLREKGLDSEQDVYVVVLEMQSMESVEEIHHRLADRGTPHLIGTHDETLLILPADRQVLAAAIGGLQVYAGVSDPVRDLSDWSTSRHEARWALYGALNERREAIRHFTRGRSEVSWIPADLASVKQAVSRFLADLIAYDEDKNSELVHTLRVYFDTDRQLAVAAKKLMIHKHTLSYRLKRIQEITGKELTSMTDTTDLFLAVKALDTLRVHDRIPKEYLS